ncbi:MAG: hypothetical protein EZS28_055664, partial [Streblomastix strix]
SLTNDTDFQILLTPGQVQLLNRKVQNFEHNKELRDFMIIGFNPNQYIDDLNQIPSQDQQEYNNELDQYQMQRNDEHDSNDDVFGEADLIELQVRGRRGSTSTTGGNSMFAGMI